MHLCLGPDHMYDTSLITESKGLCVVIILSFYPFSCSMEDDLIGRDSTKIKNKTNRKSPQSSRTLPTMLSTV